MVQEFLITSVLREQNIEMTYRLADKYFTGNHISYVAFIKSYLAANKTLPSKLAVEQKFNVQLKESPDPSSHWYREVQDAFKKKVVEKAVIDVANNPKKGLETMQLAILEATTEQEVRVVSFDENAKGRFAEYRANKGQVSSKYRSTGNDTINSATYGYAKADFWIIGGEEGSGKTWIMLWLTNLLDAILQAEKDDKPILFINTEVDEEELIERLDSIRFSLPYGNLLSGLLTPVEEAKWAKGLRNLKSNIKIVDDCFSMEDLEKYITLYSPAAVFADSIHLLVEDYDWKDIAKLGARCKKMAKKHKCPIIANTHLKANEGKQGTGTVDSFAYGKGFTRNASVAMLIYKTDQMELAGEIGFKFVKVRRGIPQNFIFSADFQKMKYEYVSTVTSSAGASSVHVEDDATKPKFGW